MNPRKKRQKETIPRIPLSSPIVGTDIRTRDVWRSYGREMKDVCSGRWRWHVVSLYTQVTFSNFCN